MTPIQPFIPAVTSLASLDRPLSAWSRVAGEPDAAGGAPFIAPDGAAPASPSFSGLLEHLVNDTRTRDIEAQRSIEAFARGDDPGRIHEVMVAVSKAEIALRTMASVKSKMLSAFKEIQQIMG